MGGKRALYPADAEAWEKHMRLERELLAQRRDGKLAKAIGKGRQASSFQPSTSCLATFFGACCTPVVHQCREVRGSSPEYNC
jgi:hypothetical protein